jgi:hypothetical protein
MRLRSIKRIHINEGLLILRYGSIARYPLLRGIEPGDHRALLLRIAYNRDPAFFYARMPKAANSTVVATLVQHLVGASPADVMRAKQRLNRFPTMRQLDRAYKFTVVRDPTERILSAYLDKIVPPESKFRKLMSDAPDLSFESFLRELRKFDYFRNGHFLPQVRLLPGGATLYDKIAKVETLEADLADICQTIFGRYEGITQEDAHATGAAARADDVVTPNARMLIAELFAEDFAAFGYRPPA